MKPLVHTVGRERIETRELAKNKFATVILALGGEPEIRQYTSEVEARAGHDQAVKESSDRQNAEK